MPKIVYACIRQGCNESAIDGSPLCEGHRDAQIRQQLGKVDAMEPVKSIGRLALKDAINPSHYKVGGFEVIDIIEAFRLGFRLGNVIKYILRHGRKGAALEDLKKARWYLDREIAKRETEE